MGSLEADLGPEAPHPDLTPISPGRATTGFLVILLLFRGFCILFRFVSRQSLYVAQAGLELLIFLLLPPK